MITQKGIRKKTITPRKLGAMNKPDFSLSRRNLLVFLFGFIFFTGSLEFASFAFVNFNFVFKTIPRILLIFFHIQVDAVLDHVDYFIQALTSVEVASRLFHDDLV